MEVHIHSADSQGEQLEMTGWNWGEVAGEREGEEGSIFSNTTHT